MGKDFGSDLGEAIAGIAIGIIGGLALGALLLSQRDILGFARDAGRFNGEELPAIALDV